MKQFTMSLMKNSVRPVVKLQSWNSFRALLDTGAFFPVWTADESLLYNLGATLKMQGVSFSGFGGSTKGNLYELQSFVLGDLIFPNMHMIACKDLQDVPFQLILSATMFCGLIYEIDDKNHKLNITVPDGESIVRNLRIEDSAGRLHILAGSA